MNVSLSELFLLFLASKMLRAVEPQEKILNHEGAKDAKKNIF